ncbi:MAG TPA: PAS domain S-box protein, partial [Roseiflexaceae bacterium]|nr:PAS domain S-box protein [Roseiflexaceae bacterium]
MDFIAEHARALLDAGPDAVVVVDAQRAIVFVNAKTLALFGYQDQELIGQPIESLLPMGGHNAHPCSPTAQDAPTPWPATVMLELYARHRDGAEFPVEITRSKLHTMDGLLISIAIRDISNRKRLQEQLIAARTEAERANRAKSVFLATASHNLRQPLQTLSLLNSVLEKTAIEPTVASAVGAQRAALVSVSELLNALLDISKLESGAIRPDITDC